MYSIILLVITVFSVNAVDLDPLGYLKQFGYYNPHSFAADSNVKNSIEDFQKFHNLKVSGVIDDATKTEMKKPRCGLPDPPKFGTGNAYFKTWWNKWGHTDITYRFLNTGTDLTLADTKKVVKQAFDMWAAVTPLTFREVTGRGNINIGWYHGRHGHGDPFNGRGGVLAHAFFPKDGRLHFDEGEDWTQNCQGKGTDLLWVSVHEIGHAIGLEHSNVRGAIMYPTYFSCKTGLTLHSDDVKGIQSLYGKSGTGGTGTGGGNNCTDSDNRCPGWARRGECNINPRWMKPNCRKSCRQC